MTILVTGGAGFIGSNFISNWFTKKNEKVINLDLLTYAGNLSNLDQHSNNKEYIFFKGDINDKVLVSNILKEYEPRALINFAAESHVDRSIDNPQNFVKTNILGTFNLLESSLNFFNCLNPEKKEEFRFLHISTDEVFGSLNSKEKPFKEESKYAPNSPYSASKASSDHLVRSFYKTYKLPAIITYCTNNYGPYQLAEKFIPLIINNAIKLKEITIYGDGENIRDWIYVKDNCNALMQILEKGKIGQTYCIGSKNEKTNNEVVLLICEILDKIKPIKSFQKIKSYKDLITYVPDRKGHDRRYAINSQKLRDNLNWYPESSFITGINKTINWYLLHQEWVNKVENFKK